MAEQLAWEVIKEKWGMVGNQLMELMESHPTSHREKLHEHWCWVNICA